uniref:Uncharacterized protein n=1 Tax=viral metagenome TaxID=1070528 RepID=A0A6C0I612_9ZZZZ
MPRQQGTRKTTGTGKHNKTMRNKSVEEVEYFTAYPTIYVKEGRTFKKVVDVKSYFNNDKEMVGLMKKMQQEVNKDPLKKQGCPLQITYESGLGMVLDGVPKRAKVKALAFHCMNKDWKVTWK